MATVSKRSLDICQDPTLNKSTAFTEAEKEALSLVGLVPDVTEPLELQHRRFLMHLGHKAADLARVPRPSDYEAFIRSHVYQPAYRPYI